MRTGRNGVTNGFIAAAIATCLLAASPAADDYTPDGLRAAAEETLSHYAAADVDLPLDVKAEFLEWELWRYHRAPHGQVYNRARLPERVGERPDHLPGSDTSTWNGALLAALSYKYAATKDPETLRRIAELVGGLHLFFHVTGQPGLPARSVTLDERLRQEGMRTGASPEGRPLFYRGDPAKGTVNQLAGGYAALMMHADPDLPADIRRLAHDDLTDMVLHLIEHDYRLTERDGTPTTYGDLTPLAGSVGVPFNAQVAYQIVALGETFPPGDVARRRKIHEAFRQLREKHHVYYEAPLRSLIHPQRVAASPFLKGMNDRNHVTNAAFVGLALELFAARRDGREADRDFLYQLGQTMCYSLGRMGSERNALCNFMWAALLRDPAAFDCMIREDRRDALAIEERAMRDGVEQLRRYGLDRFDYPGREVESAEPLWVDQRRSDDYQWKADPRRGWQVTGPATNNVRCAIDFLYAYWLLRYYRLDEHPALDERAAAVLRRTPRLRLSPPAERAFLNAAE